ncbi:MAG: AEC family transporter [Hyphomicrobiales bacterium]
MEIILDLTLPFFAVIGLGIFAVRTNMIDASAAKIINVFVFNFTMPALVISGLARQDFDALIDGRFLFGWALAGLLLFAIGGIISRLFFSGKIGEFAVTGQASSIGNNGFLGFPLLAAAFSDEGLRIASTALLIDLMLIIPISIAILEASGGGNARDTFKRVVKGALFNPFIFAIFIGFFLSATGIGLPGPSERFVEFLAGAAGPAALFALGISLAKLRFEGDITSIFVISFLKLILHPLAVFFALTFLEVDGKSIAIGVVLASLPVAGNVFVIAQQYDVMVRRASSAILISTIAAIATTAYALSWANVAG